jgi:putative metalloprotease
MAGWLMRMRGIIMLAVLLVLLGVARAGDYAQEIEKKYGLYPDFAATMRVQLIGNRLALAVGLPQASFQIFNNRELNAMAFPDGRIYITSMMATLVTDDELAFVLGHELTHVKEGHAKNQMSKATGGALLGAILVAVLGGDAGDIRTGADIAGGLTYGHYSRKDENRADDGGVRLMSQIGYDPQKAADAMQRLIDKYGRGDAGTPILGWFATHPDTQSRKNRLVTLSAQVKAKPLPPLDHPRGITLLLDPSAQHARAWLHPFLSIMLVNTTGGRTVVLPNGEYPMPPKPKDITLPDDDEKNKDKEKEKEVIQDVAVVLPPAAPRYVVTVALSEVPAGGAQTIEDGQGTAVESALAWMDTQTGMGGICAGIAQRKTRGPWRAQDELQDPAALSKLEDGKNGNIEGTLEAAALRRAARAFAEVVKADGPVDHSVPVSIKFTNPAVRVNDYLFVLRKNKNGTEPVAEIRVTVSDGKTVTGNVLWGTHTYKRGDQFVPAQ